MICLPVFVIEPQYWVMKFCNEKRGRCSFSGICTGSSFFHLKIRSSVVYPSAGQNGIGGGGGGGAVEGITEIKDRNEMETFEKKLQLIEKDRTKSKSSRSSNILLEKRALQRADRQPTGYHFDEAGLRVKRIILQVHRA